MRRAAGVKQGKWLEHGHGELHHYLSGVQVKQTLLQFFNSATFNKVDTSNERLFSLVLCQSLVL